MEYPSAKVFVTLTTLGAALLSTGAGYAFRDYQAGAPEREAKREALKKTTTELFLASVTHINAVVAASDICKADAANCPKAEDDEGFIGNSIYSIRREYTIKTENNALWLSFGRSHYVSGGGHEFNLAAGIDTKTESVDGAEVSKLRALVSEVAAPLLGLDKKFLVSLAELCTKGDFHGQFNRETVIYASCGTGPVPDLPKRLYPGSYFNVHFYGKLPKPPAS